MNASWWPRRASASDTANPPRTTIRAARSFDPSSSGSSSTPTRSRTASNAAEGSRKLTVLVHALGIGSSSLSKSKSRERLRSSGTSSTPESARPSPVPPLIQTATFFASGAGAAPVAASSVAAPSRRVPKSSVGSSSRIPRSSPNRQTVVSTESGSSWAATTSSADPPDQFSMWEPTTPSSGSEAKQSFQSMGMVVGEDPFARAPATVWVAKGKAPEVEIARKKEREKERVRKLAVSAGSGLGGGLDDGSVSPLSLSPMSAFPSPPDSMGFGLPRRSASALASGSSSSVPRPAPHRSHSAHPRPGTSPQLPSHSPRTPTSQLLPPTPPAQLLPLTPTFQPSLTPASESPARKPRAPSLRVDSASPISAQQMHMHASALQDSESVMGASVYRMVDELSLSGDENELFTKEPISGGRDPTMSHGVRGASGSVRTREAMVVRGGMSANIAEMGMGNMTALASGIVTGLGEGAANGARKSSVGQVAGPSGGAGGRAPPKRPSRSELRERLSNNSLQTSNTIIPPVRQSSLYPVPRRAMTDGDASGPTAGLGVVLTSGLSLSPSTSNGASPTGSSVTSPGSTPNASTASTPNASSASVQYTTSSSRPRTRDTTPTSPSPVKQPVRLPIPRTTSPPPRVSEELLEDLDHYIFSPQITDTDSMSVELTDEQCHEGEEAGQWLAWPAEDGQHLGSGSTLQGVRGGRRPPPSPTNLPWLAGNAGRRPTRRDVVYPSGVHIIPMAALGELARLGNEEESARDAIIARTVVEEEVEQSVELAVKEPSPLNPPLSSIEEQFPTPPASAPPSSPSPVNPLTRLSSLSTGSLTSSCSSFAPEVVSERMSSRVEFSRHIRSGSYSDSELDLEEKRPRAPGKSKLNGSGSLLSRPDTASTSTSTSTSVAWRCGSGNSQKCCATRSLTEGQNVGGWKCCAERAPSGKHARCCASFVGRPCERARVSSTSSASVHEAAKALRRQRSLHLSSLSGIGSALTSGASTSASPSSGGPSTITAPGKRNRFFHRPHTSHGKSTSYGLAEDDSRSVLSVKSKEDPGPSSSVSPDDVFGPRPIAFANVASPPMSPQGRQEFKSKYILPPAKLHDHLKEVLVPPSAPAAAPVEPGLRSPRLEPSRQRSNTATTAATDTSSSHRSMLSTHSTDSPAPMRSLLPPRRVHNTSLPTLSSSQTVEQPRRFVRSIATVSQPSTLGPPPPSRPAALPTPGNGLPPPPRGRVGMQPIVSFISTRSVPTPRPSEVPGMAGLSLKHRASRESYESQSTVRRARVVPMSFLEIELEEESGEEDEDGNGADGRAEHAGVQHSQSFLDLSSRQSGDTMRETEAMFS
ncbi:hypothetical protein FRC10_007837, partial [Ceratobasidium sp. 414]